MFEENLKKNKQNKYNKLQGKQPQMIIRYKKDILLFHNIKITVNKSNNGKKDLKNDFL